MAAPAARQRTASAAISAGERGTEGFRSGAVTPLIAASMMTGVDMGLPYSPTRRQIDRGPSLRDRKSTRLNSSHGYISYAVFCLKKKKTKTYKYQTYNKVPRHEPEQ